MPLESPHCLSGPCEAGLNFVGDEEPSLRTNGFDGSAGLTTSLRTFDQTGTISTRPGYDDVTGLGTPNIAGLLGGSPGSGNQSGPGTGTNPPVHGQPQQ